MIFSSPVATAEFSKFAGILSVALSQHHLLVFEIAQLEFWELVMDREAWRAAIHGVTKIWTQLSN